MKDSWKFMRQILVSKKSRDFFRKYPEHDREIVEYFRDGGVDTFIVSRPDSDRLAPIQVLHER